MNAHQTRRELGSTALADLTTMRVGGPPTRLVCARSSQEVVDAVRDVDHSGQPLLVLGGGSNLVVGDDGFAGTVVQVRSRGLDVESADACGGVTVRVAAGEPWDQVVSTAVDSSWSGIEALAGIPGSTGATPIQNVGAYGQEVGQTIGQVRTWDRQAEAVRTFAAAECGFGYRTSRFKSTTWRGAPRYVVLEVVFSLRPTSLSKPVAYHSLAAGLGVDIGARVPLADACEAVLRQRRVRGMVLDAADHDTWSCGSFFTNPVLGPEEFARFDERVRMALGPDATPPRFAAPDGMVKTAAAWLIERAGFGRGYGLPGPVALSTKHPLAVTNRGGASAAQVRDLAAEVRDGVRERFGVELVNEPVLVGLTL